MSGIEAGGALYPNYQIYSWQLGTCPGESVYPPGQYLYPGSYPGAAYWVIDWLTWVNCHPDVPGLEGTRVGSLGTGFWDPVVTREQLKTGTFANGQPVLGVKNKGEVQMDGGVVFITINPATRCVCSNQTSFSPYRCWADGGTEFFEAAAPDKLTYLCL